jgi:hypothetical protein
VVDVGFSRRIAMAGRRNPLLSEEPRRVSPGVEEGPSAECPIGTNLGHEVLGGQSANARERRGTAVLSGDGRPPNGWHEIGKES